MPHRFLPHTADVRVEIVSPSLGELLADCLALVRQLVAGDAPVAAQEARRLELTASDTPDLVWQFARTLLDWFNTTAFIPVQVEIDCVTPTALTARVRGEPMDPARHAQQPEVKALTRHGFEVTASARGWRAELLFDV